ncbi:SCO family protein [Bowmanella denitrificans]|uniref:SCO family protein n=1 Tax=Bowmanella denitrificans TaxID=366582 RepID=UPI000C9AAB7B|nr:SCO family protein [Bowmanella denitrificans]
MTKMLIAAAMLSLGMAVALALTFVVPKPLEYQSIEWLESPRQLQNFSLQSDTAAFNNQALQGRWTIVVFGFMHCPDICPTSLNQLADLAAKLVRITADHNMAYVFVSVDPGRDALAKVGDYARFFNPTFVGLTGSEGQLKALAGSLGVQFRVSPEKDNYQVSHSVTFSIIGPEGNLVGRFYPGFNTANLSEELLFRLRMAAV